MGILPHENFFVKGWQYQEVWKKLASTSPSIVKQSLPKLQSPFIRRKPRDQDDPTRTLPANTVPMDKTTWIQEVHLQENWYWFSRPGWSEEPSSSSYHFGGPLKTSNMKRSKGYPSRAYQVPPRQWVRRSAMNLKVYRSDTADNPARENIQGVGLLNLKIS